MDVVGLTWNRWVWPLATGGETRLRPLAATAPTAPPERHRPNERLTPPRPLDDDERTSRASLRERYRRLVVGPNPL